MIVVLLQLNSTHIARPFKTRDVMLILLENEGSTNVIKKRRHEDQG